jgi:hypothetical protein
MPLAIYNNIHDGQDNRNIYNIHVNITYKNIYTSNDYFNNISIT